MSRLFGLLAPGYVALVVVGLDLIGLDLDQLVTLHVEHPEAVRVAVLVVLAVLLLLLLDPNRLGVRRPQAAGTRRPHARLALTGTSGDLDALSASVAETSDAAETAR